MTPKKFALALLNKLSVPEYEMLPCTYILSKIDTKYKEAPFDKPFCLGFIEKEEEQITITMNKDLSVKDINFTITYLLMHWLNTETAVGAIKNPFMTFNGYNDYFAQTAAVEFLLQEKPFNYWYKKCFKNYTPEHAFSTLSDIFGVNPDVIQYRKRISTYTNTIQSYIRSFTHIV